MVFYLPKKSAPVEFITKLRDTGLVVHRVGSTKTVRVSRSYAGNFVFSVGVRKYPDERVLNFDELLDYLTSSGADGGGF